MHLLLTTPYPIWPADFGGARRTLGLARALSRLGHRITLLSAGDAGPASEIAGTARWLAYPHQGQRGHFFNFGFLNAFSATVSADVDLVLAAFPYQVGMLASAALRAGVPIIYDAHNVEYDRFRSLGRPVTAGMIRLFEAAMNRTATNTLAVSESDAALMQETYGKRPQLLPNGVDLETFRPGPPCTRLLERYRLRPGRTTLFFGPLDYAPNLDALRFLLKQVWPRVMQRCPEAHLLVVGRLPPDWSHGHRNVIIAGAVADIADHIRLADVVLAPIRSGGGTRLKLIESLACGQRVVSTPFAATGLAQKSGNGLVLASHESFAEAVIDVLDDPNKPDDHKAGARALSEPYAWDALVAQIDWHALGRSAMRGCA